MENHVGILEKIGLSQKESYVYLALLRVGQGSASLVAKNSGLKRPTTYLVLEELRKKGYVLKMPGNRKQMFIVKSPQEIIDVARKNINHASNILPELMNMYTRNTPSIRTIHFENLNGIKEAFNYKFEELKNSEIVAFLGSAKDASPDLIKLFHEWNLSIANSDIKLRSIVPDDNSLKEFRKNDKRFGFAPKIMPSAEYTSKTSIEVTEKFIRITMIKEQQSVIIENPVVAKAMKEIFEMVWNKK